MKPGSAGSGLAKGHCLLEVDRLKEVWRGRQAQAPLDAWGAPEAGHLQSSRAPLKNCGDCVPAWWTVSTGVVSRSEFKPSGALEQQISRAR
jgi:hypothetical protein